jgi:hypothetical protein
MPAQLFVFLGTDRLCHMNLITAKTMHAKNAATTKRVTTASRREGSGSLLGAGIGGVQENRGAAFSC